jgi:D-tyrosyl-tRNA(Tyr) deacylase
MRAVLQRVRTASVTVDGEVIGAVGQGLLALVGAGHDDDEAAAQWLLRKTLDLRVFPDEEGKMNQSLVDIGGALLVVSQFTLLGDCRKGRRPSFAAAMEPGRAEELYDDFVARAREAGVEVATGRFGAMMDVALVNDGPVTLLLDSERKF